MGLCFNKDKIKKFVNKQKKEEYYNKRVNMFILGNYKPMAVYHGNKDFYNNQDIIMGLNSCCINEIHIALGINPNRLILSHIKIKNNIKYKDESFHIMLLLNEINTIDEITQYNIYNAIQEYIIINKKEPKNDDFIIAT
jgi:hypothetical protein